MNPIRSFAPKAFPERLRLLLILSLCATGLSACGDFRYPHDPNDTLERVLTSESMRVVAVDHVPWVILDNEGAPKGAEVQLVEAFARDLGVTVEWRRAPAFEAFEALKNGDADLVIGGFTQQAITAHKKAASTYGYFTEELIVAAEPGTPVPQDLEGVKVHVDPNLMADGLVRERGGIPVAEKDESVRLVALPRWQAASRNLMATDIILQREKHVMAVPKGENAWIVRLEQFLRQSAGDMAARFRETAP